MMLHTFILLTFLGAVPNFKHVGTFPTTPDSDEFYLDMPTDMASAGDFLYVVDQNEHCIIKLTMRGTFVAQIGRQGQGPGEFNYPSSVATDGKRIIVYDNSRKFQILSSEGTYQSSFKIIEPVFDFVIQGDVIHSLVINRVTGGFLMGHTLQGSELFKQNLDFESRYENFFQDNSATIHIVQGQTTLLQTYHPALFAFAAKGKPIKQVNLEFSPFADQTYLDTGYQYAYQDFVSVGDQFLAFYASKGGLKWCLFSAEGALVERGFLPFQTDEMVSLVSANLQEVKGSRVVYLLVNHPEKEIRSFHLSQEG